MRHLVRFVSLSWFVTAHLVALSGCGSPSGGGCSSDSECKRGRVCVQRLCVEPGSGGGGTTGGGTGGSTTGGGTGGGTTGGGAGGGTAGGSAGGTAATTTQMVGPTGATVTLQGLTLTIPAGAVTAPTPITITQTTSVPSGYTAYSPLYRFEPDGQTFTQPLTVSIPFVGDPQLARLFWSRRTGGGYERLGGIVSGANVTMQVTHFSTGFIANGVSYTDPPDRSCTVTKLLEGRTGQPRSSSVAAFFTVDDCLGRPVTGLTCASYPSSCDFVIKENSTALSTEAQAAILPRSGVTVFASVVLDVSASTQPQVAQVIAGARAFVEELHTNRMLAVPISIQLFAGESTLTEWQAPTLNTVLLLQRLNAVATYVPADINSTNLNGAVIQALNRLETAETDFKARNFGGAFTAGYVVLFTDGADTSALQTEAQALAAIATSKDQVLAVGLQSADFTAAARASLERLAPNSVIVSQGPTSLYGDFANLAARIAGQVNRLYLLGYCSPKRAGSHTVGIEVTQSTTSQSATYQFNAGTFMPGCLQSDFASACTGTQCGGLGCGACDDRAGACSSATQQCVSYCVGPPLACDGQTITNPRGYEQVCANSPQVAQCSGACRSLLTDSNHCNGCGNACPTGGICSNGMCVCPGTLTACTGACADMQSNASHCGACGNACPTNLPVCESGACAPDREWSRWITPAEAPANSAYTIATDTVTDTVTGLTWQRSVSGTSNWTAAKMYCAGLSMGGMTGWRLPSAIELLSIVDSSRINPSINTTAFPSTPAGPFWTSTPYAGSSGSAWDVVFWDGSSNDNAMTNSFSVRCVL